MSDNTNLIPVFIPALGAILIAAEDKKDEPLTIDEVLYHRANLHPDEQAAFDAHVGVTKYA